MSEVQSHAPGTFSWIELSTSDPDGAKAFYSQLFGWSPREVPMGDGMTYTLLQIGGQDVAALYGQMPDQISQGIPPNWLSYVTVASADAAAEQVRALGGQVMGGPFDVGDHGRMAVVADPTGAAFALWEPRQHIGSRRVDEPGTRCWSELATRDVGAAEAFYTQLFGWGTRKQDMGSFFYTSFTSGEHDAGGMMPMTEEWGDLPSHWLVYLAVDDCDATAEKARALGGKVLYPPSDIPEVGRFAVLQDPQGAVFSILKPLPRS